MKQPKALYLLNSVSMWECFSYYGMRVLLVLFMVDKLGMDDHRALGCYALYTTLIELGGIAGGVIADRFLGLRRSIMLGGCTIVAGHLCLAVPDSLFCFFLGLGTIIIGTSLFRSNIAAFLGAFYEENDPRRDSGYTLYYTGINIGGFLAAICCGFIGETYGWHAGFGLAALGMLSGMITLQLGRKILLEKGELATPVRRASLKGISGLLFAVPFAAAAIFYQEQVFPFLPLLAVAGIAYFVQQTKTCSAIEKKGLKTLAFYIVFLILFYTCEEQLGSTLILFSSRHIDTGFIPASSLVTLNPLTILIAGPLLARLLNNYPLQDQTKIGISFTFLGLAFAILYIACLIPSGFGCLLGSIVLISLGEIFIGPTLFSKASSVTPSNRSGLVMSMVTFGFALANLLSGKVSQMMAITEGVSSLETYRDGFLMIALLTAGLAAVLFCVNVKKRYLTYE